MRRRTLSRSLPILLLGLLSLSFGREEREVAIEGRVFCVDSSRAETPCPADARDFALQTEGGDLHFFHRDDTKSRMFQDPQVRDRKLHVNVWPRADGYVDIIKVFSLKDGQLHDLHYFCSVCNITAFAGGPCWCCQQEFEFREIPVPDP
jgi:hypothetical protein